MTSTTSSGPRQTKSMQFVDAATLIVLLFATLFATTFLFAPETEGPGEAKATTSISQLNISEAEKRQFERMKAEGMVDDETVAALTEANAPSDDKYRIEWLPLIGLIALAAVYLGFVYVASFREYREVIEMRFGPGGES